MNKMISKLKNTDGTFNGKIIVGVVSLVILLAQQIGDVFGLSLKHYETSIMGIVNTILAILGVLGVVENPTRDEPATNK